MRERESAGKGVVIEKNERLRALKTVLVVLCERAMDHLVTSMYWIGDNGDLWWHLRPYQLNTGPQIVIMQDVGGGGGGLTRACVHMERCNVRETRQKL